MGKESRGGRCQTKRPHFFKVFFPGHNSQQLEIPPGFRKHIEGQPASCSLMGPSGNFWTVDLVENTAAGLFFLGGWREFVQDHAMEAGEFLVFIYDGASVFRVLVFDASACEKEGAFRAFPSRKTTAAKRANGLDAPHASTGFASGKNHRSDEDFEVGGKEAPVGAACTAQRNAGGSPDQGRRGRWPRVGDAKMDRKKISHKRRSRGRLVSQRRPVTEEEIERAHRAANSFTSENPFHVLIMRKSVIYIGHCMPLPHVFAKCYLPKVPQKIILTDCKGNSWEVTYLPLRGTYIFSAGWRQFCLDNHLEEDDACVFELIKANEIRVHIFRVLEEVRPFIRTIIMNHG